MKVRIIITFLLVSINICFSQENKKSNKSEILTVTTRENGKVENGIYTCNLFDWKITIPENYKITDLKRTEELENKGY
jgi:hypothetical protein